MRKLLHQEKFSCRCLLQAHFATLSEILYLSTGKRSDDESAAEAGIQQPALELTEEEAKALQDSPLSTSSRPEKVKPHPKQIRQCNSL